MAPVETPEIFEQQTDHFLKWLRKQHGTAISPKIRIADLRQDDQGRGVVALEDIEADQELFTLPYYTVLTVENSTFYQRNRGFLQKLDAWAALVLTLIYEESQGSNSSWESYLRILPVTLDTLMYWSDKELVELQASAVLGKIGRNDAEDLFKSQLWPIAKAHASQFGLYEELLGRSDADKEFVALCHRMASLIFAYGFDLDPDRSSDQEWEDSGFEDTSDEPKRGMVPLADLLNADGELKNAHLVQSENTVTMTAIKPIKAGDQIFNDFGELPRSDLLRRYGYITDRYKKWDVVEIPLTLITTVIRETEYGRTLNEKDMEQRLSLADHWQVLDDGYDLTSPDAEERRAGFPSDLVLLVTALQMNSDEFQKAKTIKGILINAKVSNQSHGTHMTWKTVLTRRLQQYDTTIAEDSEILNSADLTKRNRMAVEVRLGEKEILASWIHEIGSIITNMSSDVKGTSGTAEHKKQRRA